MSSQVHGSESSSIARRSLVHIVTQLYVNRTTLMNRESSLPLPPAKSLPPDRHRRPPA